MQKTLALVVGAAFGVVLVATCGGKMMGTSDAGAQSGPAKVLTADTDVNQLATGVLTLNGVDTQKLADGPLVLTDAIGAGPASLFVGAGADCSQAARSLPALPIQGTRWVIGAGETLCVQNLANTAKVVWSGFRPY